MSVPPLASVKATPFSPAAMRPEGAGPLGKVEVLPDPEAIAWEAAVVSTPATVIARPAVSRTAPAVPDASDVGEVLYSPPITVKVVVPSVNAPWSVCDDPPELTQFEHAICPVPLIAS